MRFGILLCAGLLLARAPMARAADAPDPKDLAAVKSCVERQEKASTETTAIEVCIGTVAKPCFRNDETSVPDAEVTQCFDREQRAWDKLLNDAYKALQGALDNGQQVKLRDMQRAWLASREKSCMFFYDYFQGTMANPMIASCQNKERARRAVFLRVFAQDSKTNK
jgi:uncharacterized protein YecT (DUF1311 family)